VAVAGAVLQRDAPLPSRWPGHRLCVGPDRLGRRARDRERGVAREPLGPVDIWHAERIAEQQAPKACAVDEQRAGNAALAIERQGADVPAFGIPFDGLDPAFDPPHPALLGVLAQQWRERGGIEMVGVRKIGAGFC
jgi:hypothetical protein